MNLLNYIDVYVIEYFKFSYFRPFYNNEAPLKHAPEFKLGEMMRMTRGRYDDTFSFLRWIHKNK